jgi:hypothetical protein
LPYGASGVAFTYSTAMMFWVVPCLAWCTHGTTVSLGDLLPAVGRPFVSAMAAVGITYIAQSFYGPSLVPLMRLVLGGVILVFVYMGILLWVMGQKELYLDLFRELKVGAFLVRATS